MSDLLAAAAAALGLPESLVQRSAAARAAETGTTADEVLAAWAGGGEVPVAQPVAAPAAATSATPAETVAAPAAAPLAAPPPPPVEVITVPYKAPILVGARDTTMSVVVGAVGLFLVVLFVGLVGPSISLDSPGARSSEIAYSQTALDGKGLYGSLGCSACHTQMVRPVVADVGLGLVTLNDSNQVIGVRRFGPDLSDVGTRMSPEQIEATVAGETGEHPPHDLADRDMDALIAYLTESRTTEG